MVWGIQNGDRVCMEHLTQVEIALATSRHAVNRFQLELIPKWMQARAEETEKLASVKRQSEEAEARTLRKFDLLMECYRFEFNIFEISQLLMKMATVVAIHEEADRFLGALHQMQKQRSSRFVNLSFSDCQSIPEPSSVSTPSRHQVVPKSSKTPSSGKRSSQTNKKKENSRYYATIHNHIQSVPNFHKFGFYDVRPIAKKLNLHHVDDVFRILTTKGKAKELLDALTLLKGEKLRGNNDSLEKQRNERGFIRHMASLKKDKKVLHEDVSDSNVITNNAYTLESLQWLICIYLELEGYDKKKGFKPSKKASISPWPPYVKGSLVTKTRIATMITFW